MRARWRRRRGRSWARSSRVYLVASLALAVASALLLRGYTERLARASQAVGRQLPVLVAGEPIDRGTAAQAGQLALVQVPEALVPPGALSSSDQAAGRVALTDIARGEMVTETRLARVRAGPVASLVPEGLRAFAVPTSLPPGSVAPGDRVDVLATFGSGQPHTETVAEEVEVLLILGPSAEGGGAVALDAAAAGVEQSQTLILLVSPTQQEELAFARAFADLAITIAPAEEG